MDTKTFPVEGIKHVVIEEMSRDARLRGDAGTTVVQVTYQPAASPADFTVEGDTLVFRGGPAARVSVPPELAVTVITAEGELRAQDLAGTLEVTRVARDLRLKQMRGRAEIGDVGGGVRADDVFSLRLIEGCAGDLHAQALENLFVGTAGSDVRLYQMGSVHLGQVRGDLRAELLTGQLEVAVVAGDVRLLDIAGLVSLQEVAGDMRALGLKGGLQARSVAGDAELHGAFTEEEEYALAAVGDIALYLPVAAHVRLSVAAGGRIRSDVHLTPAPDGSTSFTGSVGRAATHISLEAGGDLRILQIESAELPGMPGPEPEAPELHQLGEHIRQQVSASLAAAGIDVNLANEGGRSRVVDSGGGVHRQAARSQGASRVATGQPASRGPSGPTPAEQMVILKMVEDGTITAQEAEVLFEALNK